MIEVVTSVPHSGTRTLVEHLGLGLNSPRGRWMHFGYDMDEPRIASGQYHLHIPIRNPVEVARSWGRRGKSMDRLLEAYQSMFRHMENIPHTCHKIEDIEPLAGIKDRDRGTIKDESRLDEYEGKVLLEVVLPHLDFFKGYYGG